MWEMKNLPKFQATIIKDLKTYPIPLREVPEVKTRQKLFNDGERKECGRCHNLKPYDQFGVRKDSRSGTKYLRSNCKSCLNDLGQIRNITNKYHIIMNIYNGSLEGKCQKCKTGPEMLPALEFHHPFPELKSRNLKMRDKWEKNIIILEKEKAIILCKNCHSSRESYVYNSNKSLINVKLMGNIDTKIKYVKKNISNTNDLKRVIQLVKKREVIRELYGSKCIGCRKNFLQDNLPALQFHHRDEKNDIKRSETSKKIKNYEYNHLKEWLLRENCVALCGNCHKMLHSKHFEKNHKEVIGEEHSEEIRKYYIGLRRNIKDFSFEKKSK